MANKKSKRFFAIQDSLNGQDHRLDIEAAVETVKAKAAKFDEGVDVAVRLGVDPKHADQMVRGAVALPHGTGKDVRVVVFAQGEAAKAAQDAGGDEVGGDDLVAKIQGGWFEFDKAVATTDMMGKVGESVESTRAWARATRSGTNEHLAKVAEAVGQLKSGKIDFRVEKAVSFTLRLVRASDGGQPTRRQLRSAGCDLAAAQASSLCQGCVHEEHHALINHGPRCSGRYARRYSSCGSSVGGRHESCRKRSKTRR